MKASHLVVFLFLFCTFTKTNAQTNKLFETFWAGKKGTMYFINPIKFSLDKNQALYSDFTFTYHDEIKDSVTMNFSLSDKKKPVENVKTISLKNGEGNATFSNLNLMFKEKTRTEFRIRYTVKLDLKSFVKILSKPEWIFTINNLEYIACKRTQKDLTKLKSNLFFLFDE